MGFADLTMAFSPPWCCHACWKTNIDMSNSCWWYSLSHFFWHRFWDVRVPDMLSGFCACFLLSFLHRVSQSSSGPKIGWVKTSLGNHRNQKARAQTRSTSFVFSSMCQERRRKGKWTQRARFTWLRRFGLTSPKKHVGRERAVYRACRDSLLRGAFDKFEGV